MVQALQKHFFKVSGIVRFQHARLAWQVKVPQTRNPKAQRSCAQHRVEHLAFSRLQWAHRLVGVQHGLQARVIHHTGVVVDAPVVDAHTQVEQPVVHACKIKIKHTAELVAHEHHVVAKHIGMHRTSWHGGVGR